MSDQDTIQDTMFLQDREARIDDSFAVKIGPQICTFVLRMLKVADMFSVEHSQTAVTAREFTEFLDDQFNKQGEENFKLQMTDANFFVNGQLVKLDSRSYATTLEVKTTFLGYSVNEISFSKGIQAGELVALVQALKDVKSGASLSLENFKQPHLELAQVAEQELDVPEQEDPRREIIELYAGLMIKCSVYFHRLKRDSNPSAKHIKRLTQRIADEIGEHGDVFVGLINIRMIRGQDFVHSVNTCIYAMMLAEAIALDRQDVVRCGMTALTQDLERMQGANEEPDEHFETGDDTHFKTNLSAVMTLSQMGAADVLSALRLVTSYERGFPFNKPLPTSWYREELKPHLLSRIVEIARHYDVMTQGLEGVEQRTPDLALQGMMMKMGAHYDPNLMKLFVNVIGIYPVGCIVELSTMQRAMVLRSPSVISEQGISEANRPMVRLMDGSDRILDLSSPSNQGVRVIRIIENDEVEDRPGAFFLF